MSESTLTIGQAVPRLVALIEPRRHFASKAALVGLSGLASTGEDVRTANTLVNTLAPTAIVIAGTTSSSGKSVGPSKESALLRRLADTWPPELSRESRHLLPPSGGLLEPYGSKDHRLPGPFRSPEDQPIKVLPSFLETVEAKVIMSPAVERHAKAQGLYGSVVAIKETVRQIMMDVAKGVSAELRRDPEVTGPPTICFIITTSESPERIIDLDDAVQTALYHVVPPEHRLRIAFLYRFS